MDKVFTWIVRLKGAISALHAIIVSASPVNRT